jgi:hypothetical protein
MNKRGLNKYHLCPYESCDELLITKGLYCHNHCNKCQKDHCNKDAHVRNEYAYDYCRDHICNNGNYIFDVCNVSKKYPFEYCGNCLCSSAKCAEKKLTTQKLLPDGKCRKHSNVCIKAGIFGNCPNQIAPNKTYCSEHECRVEECTGESSSRQLCVECIQKYKLQNN